MKKIAKMQRHLNLSVDLDTALEDAARTEGISVNVLCSRALTEYVSVYKKLHAKLDEVDKVLGEI